MFSHWCIGIALAAGVSPTDARRDRDALDAVIGLGAGFQRGPEAFAVGPLPPPFASDPDLVAYHAAYLCDVRGVLGSYWSVQDCRPVALAGQRFRDDPELTAAIRAAYPVPSLTLWQRRGWIALGLSVVIGFLLAARALQRRWRRATLRS